MSCLNCKYKKDNKCYWFKYIKNEEPKIIPDKIINEGCKQYCDHPLLLEIIKIFRRNK